MLFGRIRRVHGTLKFIHSRTPAYIRLARQDVTALRRELLEALLSLGIGAAAGMFFMCFLSVAIIVTVWDSRYRVLTTWLVCGMGRGGGRWLAVFQASSQRTRPVREPRQSTSARSRDHRSSGATDIPTLRARATAANDRITPRAAQRTPIPEPRG
jgi:hypothetical protein